MEKIRIGIIGGAGYTAGELLRVLLNHPAAEIAFVHSSSHAGQSVADVHCGLYGDTEMTFDAHYRLDDVDVLFLCSGHGASTAFWKENKRPSSLKVIDLAQDFRDESEGYVYGLAEWQKEKIAAASLVANPGCFATAIQIALLPLAAESLLSDEINITALTGSTGAGAKPGTTTHFSWRTGNVSAYKVFGHQHLIEVSRNLSLLQGTHPLPDIHFIPMRGDFARGIFATVHTRCSLTEGEAFRLYSSFYQDAAFTFVAPWSIDLKQVVNTNKCLLSLEKHGDQLVICSAVDNLLKGASGQAVQNMNLMFGLDEQAGLRLKASAF